MTTEPEPPKRSPGTGVEYKLPRALASSQGESNASGNPSTPPDAASAVAQDDSNPAKPPSARSKTTSQLLSSYQELEKQKAKIRADLLMRRQSLEVECYPVLGSALFALRTEQPVAPAYDQIASSLGHRMKRKLDQLAELLDIDD